MNMFSVCPAPRSQIHSCVDVPNVFQLAVLKRPVLNLRHGAIGKVNKNVILSPCPAGMSQIHMLADVPNVFQFSVLK